MKLLSSENLENNLKIFYEKDHGLGYWTSEIRYKSKISWPGCVHNGTCEKVCLVLSFDEISQNKNLYIIRKHIGCSEKRFSICYREKLISDRDFAYLF